MGGGKASKETIGIHHYEASWIDGGKGLNLKGRIIQSAKYYFPPVSILYDLYKSLIRS